MHVCKIRKTDFRKRLLARNWVMRGAYAEKRFGRRYIMSRIVSEDETHFLVLFECKEYFWKKILEKSKK